MYVLGVAQHMFKVNTAQKMKFSSTHFSVNMTKCGITFTEKILNEKLFFFYSERHQNNFIWHLSCGFIVNFECIHHNTQRINLVFLLTTLSIHLVTYVWQYKKIWIVMIEELLIQLLFIATYVSFECTFEGGYASNL